MPWVVSLSSRFRYSVKSKTVGLGASDFKITVYLSGIWMSVNQALWPASCATPTFGSRTRKMFQLTSSLVNSGRCGIARPAQGKFQLPAVGVKSQLSASMGCGWRFWS